MTYLRSKRSARVVGEHLLSKGRTRDRTETIILSASAANLLAVVTITTNKRLCSKRIQPLFSGTTYILGFRV